MGNGNSYEQNSQSLANQIQETITGSLVQQIIAARRADAVNAYKMALEKNNITYLQEAQILELGYHLADITDHINQMDHQEKFAALKSKLDSNLVPFSDQLSIIVVTDALEFFSRTHGITQARVNLNDNQQRSI